VAIGSFCLVLHGHLPWVLHHGHWPHGEVWLFEAAAETYLPLLEAFGDGSCPVTLGLMPVLLEQLGHPRFTEGFARWLGEQAARALRDAAEFTARGDGHLAWLAEEQHRHFLALSARFDAIGRDIPRAFGALAQRGAIELLTSNATHGYMPFLKHDACSRAQVRAGVHTSQRRLGFRPAGAWLPECAYRPGGPWTPPVGDRTPRHRAGVEEVFGHEGVGFFFVDAHLFAGARSEGTQTASGFTKVPWDQATWDETRGWRSVLEPHLVSSDGGPGRLLALARHPEVSEQVWSGDVGYPGDGRYLEFHKRHGRDGLRYWRVTAPKTDLGAKLPYAPDEVQGAVYAHAQHFGAVVRSILKRHHERTGRHGTVVAPFDAELFGHWWHEGPRFIREVMACFAGDDVVRPATVSQVLRQWPADKVVSLPEGSWGEGGDHRVWLNDETRWMLEAAHGAEDRLLDLLARLDWRGSPAIAEPLKLAARELLLLQASDWQFVIKTRGAVDYGYRRFCEHLARFDRACTITDARARGEPDDEVTAAELADIRLHDACFEDLRLEWWS
jgi:1,4-alpha-glucan branching enzyme